MRIRDAIRDAVDRAMDAECRRREALLEYAAELAIRNRAPVTVLMPDPVIPHIGYVYEIPAGQEA